MSKKFAEIKSVVALIDQNNIDTDVIIPKDYIKGISSKGLGKYLFAYLRNDSNNNPRPQFVLNQPPYDQAQILLAPENFGCGSSREHAVWAIKDFGIRVILAKSFSDIFYENCLRNFILPGIIEAETYDKLKEIYEKKEEVHIILESTKIYTEKHTFIFNIPKVHKHHLLKGEDYIDSILTLDNIINEFEEKHKKIFYWLWN